MVSARVPPNTSYPSPEDIEAARSADALYGNPMGGYGNPGAVVRRLPADDVVQALNSQGRMPGPSEAAPQDLADAHYANLLATNRSALAALGYDPSHMVSTPVTGDRAWTVAGVYRPSRDDIWYDERHPVAALHEATHRGIEALRRAGRTDLPERDEEPVVRMLQLRHFGDVEGAIGPESERQVRESKYRYDNSSDWKSQLDQLEKEAAQEIKRRRSGGPR